ncbi:ABC transporter substrate-binding protein [Pseudomonas aeruginosa]|nr:ABC transporter substrate-binding protein [Pseudomonas aeruginosa]MCV4249132.1 ABC transporter substrate-binding protein [Pseudomonas aeruginosa]MCV4254923.1 ABC transporter substrate-binding protein [Pseudomonas aeruginosa]
MPASAPRIHTVLFRQTPAALVERWRPLSVPPAFAERYRMRSWFHFLPICLLLALSGPAAAVPTEPLVLGAEDDWYPYTAYKDGRIQGMSADIVRAAFRAADTSVQLNPYPYSRCMKLALKGLIAGCFNTSPNPHILADYRLPRHPLFRAEIQLWARRDEARPVDAEQALSGRKVAVTLGYEYGDGFDRRHDLVRIPVRKDYYGFLMLQRGRVDYALAYRNTARQLFSEHPELEGQFQPVATVHHPELYLSFSRRHPQAEHLLERFDLGMQRILASGEYQKILDGWSQAADATP